MKRITGGIVAAALAVLVAHPAQAEEWCSGQVDTNCAYWSNGQVRHCLVWTNWRCQDPATMISGLPGGTCDGTADAACTDHGLFCTVWSSRTGCLIGL